MSPGEAVPGTDVVDEGEAAEPLWDLESPLSQGYIISGEANQAAPVPAVPVPAIGAAQQAVQPLPAGPPILPAEPPPVVTEPTLSAEPAVAELALPTEPIFFEEPLFLEEPLFFEEERTAL